MQRTVIATINGAQITANCDTNHSAHVIAAALSKTHADCPAQVWDGATLIATYINGFLARS